MRKRRFDLLLMLILLMSAGGCTLQRATPTDQLAELDAAIADGSYGDIHSLLVWHEGALVLESYYRNTDPETLHQVYSVTKSVTSAAFGQAMAGQAIRDLETPMMTYLGDREVAEDANGGIAAITVEDLLTMRAGFAWDELSTIYGDSANDVTNMLASADWIAYMLDREMAATPGTQFAYNSGVSMLLGAVLADATGESVEDYVADQLFTPLAITDWQWEQTRTGVTNTGWGLYLRPIDMLKLGQLYLQEGQWQGEQILPSDWVVQSTSPIVSVSEHYGYGYQWWRFADQNPIIADLAVNDLYFAWGFGGNFIFVVPHLDLVVVTTAENFEDGGQFFNALPDYIFPAVR